MIAESITSQLEADLQQITRRLQAATVELFAPLSNVALAHVREAQPYVRAAIVLAAAESIEPASGSRNDGRSLHAQALILGSALEMLAVALDIHRLLLLPAANENADQTLDRALVGSTILTGDYCFSRAASMAAETESPHVVDLFSRALQAVSEASLRTHFDSVANDATRGENDAFLEDRILAIAGTEAICALAEVDEANRTMQMRLAALVANRDWPAAEAFLHECTVEKAPWQGLLVWARASWVS